VEQGVPQRATCEAGGCIAKGVMGTLPPGVPNVAAILRHGGTQQGQDQGLQEWRSIQDTVTLTFKAFFDALKSQAPAVTDTTLLPVAPGPGPVQGDAIRSLEQGREDLVHSLRNEMAGVLQRKANAPEVASRLAEVRRPGPALTAAVHVAGEERPGLVWLGSCSAAVGAAAAAGAAGSPDRGGRGSRVEALGHACMHFHTPCVPYLVQLEACVGRKADTEDMERRAIKAEVDATLRSHMAAVSTGLKTKMDEVEAKAWRESCERQLTALRTEVARLAAGLDEVRAALSGKASAAEVTSSLAAKVDAADLEQRLRDKASRKLVEEALACKADSSALQGVEGEVRAQLDDALHALSRKADMAVLEEVSHRHDRLRSRVEADAESAAAALRALSVTFDASLSTTAKRVDDALLAESSSDRAEAEVTASSAGSVVLSRTAAASDTFRSALRMEVQDVEDRLAAALARKAEGSEVASLARDSKAELAGLREAVGSRAPASALAAVESQVAALSSVSSRLDALQRDVANKMSTDLRVYASLETKANVDDVNKASTAQRGFEDTLSIRRANCHTHIDSTCGRAARCPTHKCSRNDAFGPQALLAVCREVEGRASADELDALSARTSAQLQRLASLTPLAGRWLWKSGRTKAGGAVPWEIQVLAPDEDRVAAARGGSGGKVGGDGAVFTWEAGSSIIGVALPGLYELSFAFFCRKRPLVQVLVNGEPILTATGSASASSSSTTIIHHAALGISATAAGAGAAAHMLASLAAPGGGSQPAPSSQHSAGNVTGLSALEFLSLPAQARLAVTVQGQQTDGVQGFLALRKM
ncbi:hypothetical protein QJQ45_015167, partial [Haematococcus lacustris]